VVEESSTATPLHPAAREYDPALLDEPADLDLERKRLVLDTFYALGRLNHYQLLGVPEEADKKAIKVAYYERVAVFHTDRYYGKNLGAFKSRLEKVFVALTKAYDTLTRNKSREEYDRYLAARRRTAGLDSAPPRRMTPTPIAAPDATPAPPLVMDPPPSATPSPDQVGTSDGERTSPYIPPPPPAPAVGTPPATPAAPAATVPAGQTPAQVKAAGRISQPEIARSPSTIPPGDPEVAKRVLARKLMGTRGSVPPQAPGGAEEEKLRSANEGLRNLYEKRATDASVTGAARYRELAEQSVSEGNLASAINALKIALSLTPEDKSLLQLLDQVEERSDAAMADQFLEQARYEEQDGQHARAARSYGRAARGKKSAQLYDRAATCLVEAGIEGRQAVEYARKATALDPKRAVYRLTLARAYYLSNMPTSGSAEMKRALELAPDHDEIKAWAKRLK
jgi:tetratricopeptide (TPR) repeat protein